MRPRLLLSLGLWLLSAAPAHALFGEIQELERRLQESQQLSPLESIVEELKTGTFTDVDPKAWYAPYIATMARRNIVSGDTDEWGIPKGTFRPSDFVTLAEALKIIFRAAGVRELDCISPPRNLYAAVHWSRHFVACAEGLGVRVLTPESFLDRAVSRAEMLALLDDVFADDVPVVAPPFRDVVTHRYGADIAHNARLKIVSGDTDNRGNSTGTFRPDDPLRRAEIAKIIARKLELLSR